MKKTLNRLIDHQTLSRDEARDLLLSLTSSEVNESQIAALLTTYLMRSITIDEILGFRDAMFTMTKQVDLTAYDAIDIVGTGGDGKNTFNISTLASFVVAGAGYNVAKHGNFGATSVSGASNVLEYFGVKFSSDESRLQKSIEKSGVAYLHAPLFNEAMKRVAPVRKSLGIRTLFNILGPLINPARPNKMLLGVYNLKLARLYAYIYQQTGQKFAIVNSLDGYDEISLTSDFKVIHPDYEEIYSPSDFGFHQYDQQALSGGSSIASAATIFEQVLNNTSTVPQKNCVILNAAYAIQICNSGISINEAIDAATKSLESGAAKKAFSTFLTINE